MLESIEDVLKKLNEHQYLADENLATVLYLAYHLPRPLLVEGPAGVGKTELAKVMARILGAKFIRLQCYEGLDEAKALYEWNYQQQLLKIQYESREEKSWQDIKGDIFTEEFLLKRPILEALTSREPVVLLVDELDKSDGEFESFLLEALSDFQVSIPEIGTVKAQRIPLVVLTSNGTRDFEDALKRRCLHLYINYPDYHMELTIIKLKNPGLTENLACQLTDFVQKIRELALRKPPGISETLDWAQTMIILGVDKLEADLVKKTLPVLIKYQQDMGKVEKQVPSLLSGSG
ncbi:MAG: MoxR family ATPase [Candidatus Syntrophonatronum acetioxidans]|uniref:MoxR family ATPase n=1 Tax=Candidatus Syntrophonatronum acetioxidans TaxID=1795816 RepID=A0A424YEL8_9FIRM|nr:MAG: MoxR family ATPase [Candidatus Syntrophonatronum acetioxidans]